MSTVEINGVKTVFDFNATYHAGERLTDKDLVQRRNFDLLKLKYVFRGDYYKAYAIDELEIYLKDNTPGLEYFFFMLEVITEIIIKRDATFNVPAFIAYMMRDIKTFKKDYENSKSISSFISEISADMEIILWLKQHMQQ